MGKNWFPPVENAFPLARTKDSFENYVSTRREKYYRWLKTLKNR